MVIEWESGFHFRPKGYAQRFAMPTHRTRPTNASRHRVRAVRRCVRVAAVVRTAGEVDGSDALFGRRKKRGRRGVVREAREASELRIARGNPGRGCDVPELVDLGQAQLPEAVTDRPRRRCYCVPNYQGAYCPCHRPARPRPLPQTRGIKTRQNTSRRSRRRLSVGGAS